MLDRNLIIRFHGLDAERFAKRFDLQAFTTPCYQCSADRVTSIPFALGSLRGLIAPTCSCGYEDQPYAVVCVEGDGQIATLMAEAARVSRARAPKRRYRRAPAPRVE